MIEVNELPGSASPPAKAGFFAIYPVTCTGAALPPEPAKHDGEGWWYMCDSSPRVHHTQLVVWGYRFGAEILGMRSPSFSFEQLAKDQAEWSQATFGADGDHGPTSALKHLALEVEEAIASPKDPMEYADLFLLTIDAARRAGVNHYALLLASMAKLAICKTRKWEKPVDGEPCQHVRTAQP